jgi:hypothetical protein
MTNYLFIYCEVTVKNDVENFDEIPFFYSCVISMYLKCYAINYYHTSTWKYIHHIQNVIIKASNSNHSAYSMQKS